MTNEQKAEVIALRDGWIKLGYYFQHNDYPIATKRDLSKLYLTDLNYLVPVAVKVRSAINNYDANKPLADIFMKLCYQMATYDKSPEGTYQPLFDAVYEAIIYLENESR